MKKSKKLGLIALALIGSAIAISGCTANFCRDDEKCRMIFAIEPGVSTYFATEEAAKKGGREKVVPEYTYIVEKVNENLWRCVEKNGAKFTKSNQLSAINESAVKNGIYVPSDKYFIAMDQIVLEKAAAAAQLSLDSLTVKDVNGWAEELENGSKEYHKGILSTYGYYKYSENNKDLWSNYDAINAELKRTLSIELCPTRDYISLYKSTMESAVSNNRGCIATVSGEYGAYGQEEITIAIEAKDWGYAWTRGGAVLEGLIVFPVAWMLDTFAYAFAGGKNASPVDIFNSYSTGVPQLLALLLVTFIVRLFIFGVSFKSTLDQQKMNRLQPELAKIQAKYPNSNTNQAEKQRLADEQMKLYKKHKVNPLSQLLILIVQFPVFIGVWGAMTGSAVLTTGKVMGLNLSQSIWTALTTYLTSDPQNVAGWVTALVLFILMAVSQFFSMKVPQWIQKARTKKVARLGKNPAQSQQNKTMTIFSYVMLVMIIVMGFTLPAAMGFYWFVGALISLLQTLITQVLMNRKRK